MIRVVPIMYFVVLFTYLFLRVNKVKEVSDKRLINKDLTLMLLATLLFFVYENAAFGLSFEVFDNMETVRTFLVKGGAVSLTLSLIILLLMLIMRLRTKEKETSILYKAYLLIVLVMLSAHIYDFGYLLFNIDKVYINLDYVPFTNLFTNWISQIITAITLFTLSFLDAYKFSKDF